MRTLCLLLIFISSSALALDVLVWKMTPEAPEVILPVKANQTPGQAVREFIDKINQSKKLEDLRTRQDLEKLNIDGKLIITEGSWTKLENNSELPRIIIVSNHFREMYAAPAGNRAIRDIQRLGTLGAKSYILPPMHDITLNAKESLEYRNKLIDLFDAQLILGGDDIDPFFYKEKISLAKGLNRKRDASELKFVKAFLNEQKGVTYGICRGHQMCSVALGKKLTQDIQIEQNASSIHLDGNHPINIIPNTEFASLFNTKKITVNSLHHQAVKISSKDKDFKIMATSTDASPVIEALELRNGKGFTMQFHPELMFDEVGDIIMKRLVTMAKENKEKQEIPCLKALNRIISSNK